MAGPFCLSGHWLAVIAESLQGTLWGCAERGVRGRSTRWAGGSSPYPARGSQMLSNWQRILGEIGEQKKSLESGDLYQLA